MTRLGAGAHQPIVELVLAAQGGDRQAVDDLITGELPRVYNVVGRALNGHTDVDDVVQETLIQVIRSLPGLRDPDRFRPWVLAIAHRQVQLYLRSRQRTARRQLQLAADPPDPSGDFASRTVTDLMLSGQRREVAEAARWLDDDERLLLSMWWQEAAGQITRAELAAALGVTPGHAAVRLKRMRDRLDAVRTVVHALRAGDCAQLAQLVRGWDGRVDARWRKRLVRHTRDCPRCAPYHRDLVPAEKLLLGLLPVPLPIAVAAAAKVLLAGPLPAQVAPAAPALWSTVTGYAHQMLHHKALTVTAAAAVLAAGGFVYAVLETPEPSESPAVIAVPGATRTRAQLSPTAALTPTASATAATPTPRPAAVSGVTSADIYVAPGGSDSGDGSLRRPFATLAKAVAAVRPGETIALRGGVYRPQAGVTISTSGTANRRITLSNYRDETPVIDAARIPANQWSVTHQAAYWTVQGLEIRNSGSHAYVCVSCRGDTFRRLSIHDNVLSGLTLRGDGTTGNEVSDSDFYGNHDPDVAGQAGVGLAIKFGSGDGNLVRGNRAFDNGDNGIDLGSFSSAVTIEDNWAYGNGRDHWNMPGWHSAASGFALGGGDPAPAAAHVLRDNAAWDNAGHGFSDDENPGALELSGNTAWHNADTGFSMRGAAASLRGNAAVDNGTAVALGPAGRSSGNTWDDSTEDTTAMFRSTDPAPARGPRRADGRLPVTPFLVSITGLGATMREK